MKPIDHEHLLQTTRCACFGLRKAARAVTQVYDEALRPVGLRTTQFSLLSQLRLGGMAPLTRLAEDTVMDRTTLARNLEVLERDGLVRIRPGADARVREVEITRAGSAKVDEAFPRWQAAQRAITRRLGGHQLDRMLADLAATVSVAERTEMSDARS